MKSWGDDIPPDHLDAILFGCLNRDHAVGFKAFLKQIRNQFSVHKILKGDEPWPSAAEDRDLTYFLTQSLREPFLFVVAGEVKAGKSSLLNAIFGREFCKVDVLHATDKVYIFKYADEERTIHVSDRLAECYRPAAFLRDFNIVDTPGTNTIVAEHQTITESFIPRADLVLFVFSVTNPWTQSAWELLNLVQKNGSRMLFSFCSRPISATSRRSKLFGAISKIPRCRSSDSLRRSSLFPRVKRYSPKRVA